ncbi:MAG: serine/threonine-protein phosphatase [Prevotella sp.]|nr:serine/threonine-protein phosphatase [Prevotella sp.]
MKITLGQSYSFLQQGLRDHQEDSRYPDNDKPSASQRYFVVCDGVGGSEDGEIASRTVCRAIARTIDGMRVETYFPNDQFSKVLDAAYNALDRMAKRYNGEMATTLTFACFHDGGCTLAHIGDSRIYHFRKGKGIIYRSEDHSLVNSMVHNGMITPDEAIDNPQKHVITRYMESVDSDQSRCMATVLKTKDVRNGDYILLCTDGVYNQVDDDELTNIILNTDISNKKKVKKLAQICEDGDDNNTAILIPIIKVESDNLDDKSIETTGETKKFSHSDSTLEEIESTQRQKETRLQKWIKQLFN